MKIAKSIVARFLLRAGVMLGELTLHAGSRNALSDTVAESGRLSRRQARKCYGKVAFSWIPKILCGAYSLADSTRLQHSAERSTRKQYMLATEPCCSVQQLCSGLSARCVTLPRNAPLVASRIHSSRVLHHPEPP